jgi:hypothetical protein
LEWFLPFDRGNELVTATANRSHEAGPVGVVVEGLTEFVDGSVQAVVKVHEGVGGPESVTELVPLDHLARTFQKNLKNVKRAVLKLDSYPILAKFRPGKIGLVRSETHNTNCAGRVRHNSPK